VDHRPDHRYAALGGHEGAVYDEAARLTEETGILHEVDHWVPLTHPNVCGLHVDWNLRAIPKLCNMAKSNYWNPDQLELEL
jgi:5-methylcytosine-specific restriction endonuclease McrA